MANIKFIAIRLGKDSTEDIRHLCSVPKGIQQQPFEINIRCTQVPDNYNQGDYAFIWLGSDNNKGAPTDWKQGFKALGRVADIQRGEKYNDNSLTKVQVLYVFKNSINRLDFLRNNPYAYYWCSSLPLIGLDDHANQTIRTMTGNSLSNMGPFFSSLESSTGYFKKEILSILPEFKAFFIDSIPNPQKYPDLKDIADIANMSSVISNYAVHYRPYITAIKTKPFLLLAGISGTGKSRIVRELARACWEKDSDEFKAQKPKNFEMVQVKPNWHDSSELIGYVSRVSGKPTFIVGDALRFIARAWEDLDTPYFLCLDEMNLAPVEQYFAEYLSVVESRKAQPDGTVVTDPILRKADEEWFFELTARLSTSEDIRMQFIKEGISIPQNLIVIGTVNMDETTFSFSRKVLDRAMTIEMNEVDLNDGLTERDFQIGNLGKEALLGSAVEGVDVYVDNREICDVVLDYLKSVNDVLEGTPFKIAYRTRNEFLLYAVNNIPYDKDENGDDLPEKFVLARALDEITSMKILSRIEGDDTKVTDGLLTRLSQTISDKLNDISGERKIEKPVSIAKLEEMKNRLASGYTSFWS